MISVQNRLRPLNGNNLLVLFLLFLLIVSCGSINAIKTSQIVLEPVEEEIPQSGGVVITTDNNKSGNTKKTTTVTFMGQEFQAPILDIEEYKIAIILPFCFNKGDRVSEQLRSVSMEYFEGAEIALQELQSRGLKVHVEVFDSKNDTVVLSNLLNKTYFKTVHLIIGPIFDSEIKLVERHCSVYGIPLVSPLKFYKKQNRTSIPIYNPVSEDTNRHYFAALQLIKLYGTSKFLMLNDNTKEGYVIRRAFTRAFNEMKKTLTTGSLDVLKTHIAENSDLVIMAPVKSDVLMHHLLNSVTGKKNIKVVGLEDWFDFPIIPFATWSKCNLLFYSNNNVDQEDEEVMLFNQNYTNKYGGHPGKLSFIAYDQMMFFIQALTAFGPNYGAYIQGEVFPLLHTSFKFLHMSNDSYENRFINILKLNESFDLEKIN